MSAEQVHVARPDSADPPAAFPNRSSEVVQNDSAHHYLDYTSVSTTLTTLLELLLEAVSFPSATIDIVDDSQQFTLASIGITLSTPTPLHDSLCSFVVERGSPIIIEDIDGPAEPVELCDALRASGMASYAGVPLVGREGRSIGALCVLDPGPRSFSESQLSVLHKFAVIANELLDSQRDRVRRERHVTRAAVAEALLHKQIVPWYQPIVDLRTGSVVGYEALARWMHPVDGMVTPDRFIDVVEGTDLIVDLDLAIVERALDDLARWREYNGELRISVNLSAQHFLYSECVERISSMALSAGVEPTAVTLELTEVTSFVDVGIGVGFLEKLRDRGFGIVLDDVGVGWSSPSRLLVLPIAGLKIDKTIIDALGTHAGDAMVRALAGFARETGLNCVGEGIETHEQALAAHEFGCTHGQGYLWSRPVAPEAVTESLAAGG